MVLPVATSCAAEIFHANVWFGQLLLVCQLWVDYSAFGPPCCPTSPVIWLNQLMAMINPRFTGMGSNIDLWCGHRKQ